VDPGKKKGKGKGRRNDKAHLFSSYAQHSKKSKPHKEKRGLAKRCLRVIGPAMVKWQILLPSPFFYGSLIFWFHYLTKQYDLKFRGATAALGLVPPFHPLEGSLRLRWV
jgi:hypothetical protein